MAAVPLNEYSIFKKPGNVSKYSLLNSWFWLFDRRVARRKGAARKIQSKAIKQKLRLRISKGVTLEMTLKVLCSSFCSKKNLVHRTLTSNDAFLTLMLLCFYKNKGRKGWIVKQGWPSETCGGFLQPGFHLRKVGGAESTNLQNTKHKFRGFIPQNLKAQKYQKRYKFQEELGVVFLTHCAEGYSRNPQTSNDRWR